MGRRRRELLLTVEGVKGAMLIPVLLIPVLLMSKRHAGGACLIRYSVERQDSQERGVCNRFIYNNSYDAHDHGEEQSVRSVNLQGSGWAVVGSIRQEGAVL